MTNSKEYINQVALPELVLALERRVIAMVEDHDSEKNSEIVLSLVQMQHDLNGDGLNGHYMGLSKSASNVQVTNSITYRDQYKNLGEVIMDWKEQAGYANSKICSQLEISSKTLTDVINNDGPSSVEGLIVKKKQGLASTKRRIVENIDATETQRIYLRTIPLY